MDLATKEFHYHTTSLFNDRFTSCAAHNEQKSIHLLEHNKSSPEVLTVQS